MGIYSITGGAGFIGSHLADALLAAGHSVRVLDNFSSGCRDHLHPDCEIVQGDVADPAAVRRVMNGVDGCFHLAAIASVQRSNEAWFLTHLTNQAGSVAVLEMAGKMGGLPVVYASSAAIYGDVGDARAHEDMVPAPRTAYGVDKLGTELHARVGALIHRVPSIGLRFFNVYGPRQNSSSPYSGVIALFAQCAAQRRPIMIHGDGLQCRDFIFVSDAVAHLWAAMQTLHQDGLGATIMNVCTGRGTSIRALAEQISLSFGWDIPLRQMAERAGDIRYSVGDPSRAVARMGIAAMTPLQTGLQSTIADILRQSAPRDGLS